MRFPYSAFVSPAPETGEEIIIFRPEVPLKILGPTQSAMYFALVDTGADNTVFPLSIARDLGITTRPANVGATAFGGQQIPLSFADVGLEITDDNAKLAWNARAYFFDFPDSEPETLIVGHQGFLDFFTAVFDGAQMTIDLEPNEDMPRRR